MARRGRLPTFVVAAFPAQGPAMLAQKLAGDTIYARRLTRDPHIGIRRAHDNNELRVDVRRVPAPRGQTPPGGAPATPPASSSSGCGCGR